MPEPFKNLFNPKMITGMGEHFTKAWPEFNHASFTAMATKNLDVLELKERSLQITEALTRISLQIPAAKLDLTAI